MDLLAYAQIDDLGEIAKRNNISVPRLRGYRLMKDEELVDISELKSHVISEVADDALHSFPPFSPDSCGMEYSERTRKREKKYGIYVNNEEEPWMSKYPIGLKMDKIHGKARRRIKFALKKRMKRCKEQYDTFNKYVGRGDVLYIHARIGGNNWAYYDGYKLEKEPWFLEKVDDWWDCTYCDIYARVK